MIVKVLTEHHLASLSLKEAAEALPSLHLSNYQIVGNSCRGSYVLAALLRLVICTDYSLVKSRWLRGDIDCDQTIASHRHTIEKSK